MFILFYFSILFSFLFFFLSFLDWDPLKSCLMMCMGIIFMSCYMSLGIHFWYSYFVVLIFLSGIFSLLTYFCSLCNYNFYYNYGYFFIFFFFFFIFLFIDLDFHIFYFDYNFVSIYYDFSYYYIFWIIFVLLLLLNMISFSFGGGSYMRGL